MHPPIRSLAGSLTHQVSTQLYQRHRDAGDGACSTCGQPMPCLARGNAARVILAAGEDPRAYEDRPTPANTPPPATCRGAGTTQVGQLTPRYTGYHLGRRSQTLPPQGFLYERDDP
jgi:hypothetical protein